MNKYIKIKVHNIAPVKKKKKKNSFSKFSIYPYFFTLCFSRLKKFFFKKKSEILYNL